MNRQTKANALPGGGLAQGFELLANLCNYNTLHSFTRFAGRACLSEESQFYAKKFQIFLLFLQGTWGGGLVPLSSIRRS